MINIDVSLYYHLRQKAGAGTISLLAPAGITIREVKQILEKKHPTLITHLDNVMILMDKKIVLDEDTPAKYQDCISHTNWWRVEIIDD